MSEDAYQGWSIVELMGRRRLAGMVTADAPLLTATRLRIDIYDLHSPAPVVSQFTAYPVYCLTPTSEAIARAVGARYLASDPPVSRWELPAAPRNDQDDEVVDAFIHDADCPGGAGCGC